jgi:hypothetical protein
MTKGPGLVMTRSYGSPQVAATAGSIPQPPASVCSSTFSQVPPPAPSVRSRHSSRRACRPPATPYTIAFMPTQRFRGNGPPSQTFLVTWLV